MEEKRRRSDTPPVPRGKFSFTGFHKYQVINDYLDQLATDYPDFVTVTDEGRSYEKRTIKSILISDKKMPGNKTLIIIDGGIHAREWISPAFCVYLVHELVERSIANKNMLEKVDWLIVPLLNPDGYEYTHEKNRFWRKTRRPDENKPDCFGVDGNRNYAHHWGETGASDEPCSETYKGPKASSEPETQLMSNVMMKMARKGRTAYLSFHSYGCWILYPWSYTSAPPPRKHLLQRVGEMAADAIHMNTGRIYKVGNTVDLLYAAAGGSHDFALGDAGIELAYTFELPPRGTGMEGFAPPPKDILSICKETMYGIREIAFYLGDHY